MKQTFALQVFELRDGYGLVAKSTDLPPFIARGDNVRELNANITAALRVVLSRMGRTVKNVKLMPETPAAPQLAEIVPVASSAIAEFEAA